MIWALDLDDYLGMCGTRWPLLTAIRTGLTGTYQPSTLPEPVSGAEPEPEPASGPEPEPEPEPQPEPEATSKRTTTATVDSKLWGSFSY